MKKIINRYLSIQNEFNRITDELYESVYTKYNNRILHSKTIDELDSIQLELKELLPNSFPLYMMIKLINKQKKINENGI